MPMCKANLPTERTDWNELEPLISGAVNSFVATGETIKLLKMQGNERTLAANLKVALDKEFGSKYGDDVWNVNNDHTRVLENGTPKKQPTDYLLEAIEIFATCATSINRHSPNIFNSFR